jgi:hypothetical protein
MPDKLYLIRFKASELTFHAVVAARAEIHGEHLLFLRSDGKLAALFLLEIVENWSEDRFRQNILHLRTLNAKHGIQTKSQDSEVNLSNIRERPMQ